MLPAQRVDPKKFQPLKWFKNQNASKTTKTLLMYTKMIQKDVFQIRKKIVAARAI